MNQLYTLVQAIINQGSSQSLEQLISSLNHSPGEKSKEYECGENVFYVVKRFVGASLARDPRIKENVLRAMQRVKESVQNLSVMDKTAFQGFFLSATDMADCKNKQQKNAYIQGKINVVKVLGEFLAPSDKVIGHLVQLANENEGLQEELVEAVYGLVGEKIKALKFTLAEGSNAKILLSILSKKPITKQTIQAALSQAIQQYPKQSPTLKHLGLHLSTILPTPSQFFSSEYSQFTNTTQEQTQDGDLKKLYYLLWVQKYFLESVMIGPLNVNKYLSTEMAVVWLEELRVKNRHMRKVAGEIAIRFDDNPEFAFQVLKLLHQKKVYLENVSQNHPFAQLYSSVDTVKFWTYLVQLINATEPSESKDQILQEQQQATLTKRQEYLSELEYVTRQKASDLTPQVIGQTLTLLIRAYQQSKRSEKLLNLVWSLFHSLLVANEQKKKSKKKIVLNLRGPLILSKINLNSLELQSQIVQTLAKVIKFLRVKTKAYKEQQSPEKLMIAVLNFVTGLILYCVVYPEEADVCGEVEFVFRDLEVLVNEEKGVKTVETEKKKVKKQKATEQPQDLKKPVHVLIDVFISLLTKAPIFLRSSINLVFEQLVPFIQTSDLDTLLDVILKPDQEYIEEI